jgi:hypothetical protein
MWMIAWGFLKTFWKPIVLLLAFFSIVGFIYHEGYNSGKEECQQKVAAEEKSRVKAVNDRIDKLAETSINIAKEQQDYLGGVSTKIGLVIKEVKSLSTGVKKLSLTTVPDCKPSDKFVEASNAIAKAANSSE